MESGNKPNKHKKYESSAKRIQLLSIRSSKSDNPDEWAAIIDWLKCNGNGDAKEGLYNLATASNFTNVKTGPISTESKKLALFAAQFNGIEVKFDDKKISDLEWGNQFDATLMNLLQYVVDLAEDHGIPIPLPSIKRK